MDIVSVAGEVIASKVDKHHVLGILLGVIAQILSVLAVLLGIACTACRAGYRVYIRMPALYAAVSLRTRPEDAESAKVEVEEIGRRIDTAQGTVQLEVITLVMLDKTAREHYLEDIAAETVAYATPDILLVLLVCKGRCGVADGMEIVWLDIRAVHLDHDILNIAV